jgi:hypothetical protein
MTEFGQKLRFQMKSSVIPSHWTVGVTQPSANTVSSTPATYRRSRYTNPTPLCAYGVPAFSFYLIHLLCTSWARCQLISNLDSALPGRHRNGNHKHAYTHATMSTNPAQLFLLADHVKLSLLERQRAMSLNLSPNSQDGQISRSLDSLRLGMEALEMQLETSPDEYVTGHP